MRLPEAGRLGLVECIGAVFEAEQTERWAGCFVVLSEHKLRVTRPV